MADIASQLPTTVSEIDDSIVCYGNDGAANQALLTDAAGRLQVDVQIGDGADNLDIVDQGDAVTTGIVAFGLELGTNTAYPLPLHNHAFASANYDIHFPVGGVNYAIGNDTAYMIKVESDGSQYCRVFDGTDVLDITQAGDVPSNGITMMALDSSAAPDVSQFIRIWADAGLAPRDFLLPICGHDYGAPATAYAPKVDIAGKLFINTVDTVTTVTTVDTVTDITNLGTDRGGAGVTVSVDTSSRALNTRDMKPDIWGDSYKYWEDPCETAAGDGLTVCKWLPTTGVPEWSPLVVADTHSVEYVESDAIGTATFTTRPYKGNWCLKLAAQGPSSGLTYATNCYTKLGEVTNKKIALEFWFSPGGLSFRGIGGGQSYALLFGFYLFDRRNNEEKRYLCRYDSINLRWEYYNNVAGWTIIATDRRPYDSAGIGWHTSAYWNWQYVKLVIDDSDDQLESLTYQDTTYQIAAACHVTAGAGGRSGLCPYFGAELECGYDVGGSEYGGAIYFDEIKVYLNDLEEFNTAPASQYSAGF